MDYLNNAAASGQLIAGLITLFGTVIVVLLGLIGWFIKRYVDQLDTRLKEHEQDITHLQTVTTRHNTEIKNIHYRIKDS